MTDFTLQKVCQLLLSLVSKSSNLLFIKGDVEKALLEIFEENKITTERTAHVFKRNTRLHIELSCFKTVAIVLPHILSYHLNLIISLNIQSETSAQPLKHGFQVCFYT